VLSRRIWLAAGPAAGDGALRAAPERVFLGVCALLFAGSAALTIAGCAAMSGMGAMPMPGGWELSMAWMPMHGQTWFGAAASFLAMWVVMMAAMMLPALAAMLGRYRRAVGGMSEARLGRFTVLVGAGYFAVWTACGAAIFALGAALAAAALRWPALAAAVPLASAALVALGGALQFTAWKARELACCREAPGGSLPAAAGSAWRWGLRLGAHCCACCAGLTAILLALGVMDLRAMVAVSAAIALERLTPAGERFARAIGTVALAAGLLGVMRAAGLA
jgi:predicted metal-binding membrane protein